MFRPALAVLVLLTQPALPQSSLGVTGFDAQLGLADGEGGSASARLDIAVTDVHGLQFDLGLEETNSGVLGTAAGHIYMTPNAGWKYGLFTVLGDVDDRSATYGAMGGEALFALSESNAMELRAGAGLASHSDLDFVFAEAGIHHDLSRDLSLYGGISLTAIDEADFSTTAWDTHLVLTYRPEGQPFGAYLEVSQDGLSGQSDDDTKIRAGLSIEFGNTRRGGPETRPFRTPNPIRPLLSRGLF